MAKTSTSPSSSGLYDPDDIVEIFGANVKAARLKQGLSQAQLAEQAGCCSNMSRWLSWANKM